MIPYTKLDNYTSSKTEWTWKFDVPEPIDKVTRAVLNLDQFFKSTTSSLGEVAVTGTVGQIGSTYKVQDETSKLTGLISRIVPVNIVTTFELKAIQENETKNNKKTGGIITCTANTVKMSDGALRRNSGETLFEIHVREDAPGISSVLLRSNNFDFMNSNPGSANIPTIYWYCPCGSNTLVNKTVNNNIYIKHRTYNVKNYLIAFDPSVEKYIYTAPPENVENSMLIQQQMMMGNQAMYRNGDPEGLPLAVAVAGKQG